jgi:hypothetical protein
MGKNRDCVRSGDLRLWIDRKHDSGSVERASTIFAGSARSACLAPKLCRKRAFSVCGFAARCAESLYLSIICPRKQPGYAPLRDIFRPLSKRNDRARTSSKRPRAVGESYRSHPLHRLSRVYDCVQVRERGADRCHSDLRQARRRRSVSPGAARAPGHALQSVRSRTVRDCVSNGRDVQAR